jgi:hypothetical protein
MPTKQFPPQPNLKNLKNQAKQLLKAHRAAQEDVCRRIGKSLPRLSTFSETEIRDAKFTLQDAQLVIAREYGFASWPKLVIAITTTETRNVVAEIVLTNLDLLPEWEHLHTALQHDTLEQAKAAIKRLCAQPDISFRAVRSNQKISANVPLQPGDHLSPTTDKTSLRLKPVEVTQIGYLSRQGNQIHVVLPIWIDGEKMVAYFLNLPQKETPQLPDLEQLQGLLEWHGINYGFSETSLKQVVEGLRQGCIRDPLVRVAEATAPQPGKDANFEWAVNITEQPGGELPESRFT